MRLQAFSQQRLAAWIHNELKQRRVCIGLPRDASAAPQAAGRGVTSRGSARVMSPSAPSVDPASTQTALCVAAAPATGRGEQRDAVALLCERGTASRVRSHAASSSASSGLAMRLTH